MSKKNTKKALSLALSLAMMASMFTVPSMAAGTHWITAALNGKEIYSESYPDTAAVNEAKLVNDLGVGVDVKVTVNDKAFTTARPINLTGTLENGTVFRIAENDDRSLSLTTTNNQLNDDISVDVEQVARSYTVTANSGPLGFKGDIGSDSNPTCESGGGIFEVDGNSVWTTTFTPVDGQVIKSLNIRGAASGRNIVSADAGTVTVGNTKLNISRNGDAVTVRADQMADNLFVTALTADRAAQYELSVVTVGDVTSSVVSTTLEAGTSKDVILTPGEASIVDTIEINDGGKTGTITTNKSSLSVNGHTYKVSRALDGKATVSVPAMAANVVITATATSNKAGLSIDIPYDVECNLPEQSYPEKGSAVEVRLSPNDDSEITSIKIQSPTDSVVLNSDEYRFILDGRVYRVDTRYDSSRVLYFDSFPGNIRISAESKETRHTITLKTDRGCDYEGNSDKLTVDDGGSKTFSFVALGDNTIERLVFTYGGKTYTVNEDDSYIRINGTRCPITWEENRVTVTLYDVDKSMTVKANTDYYDEDYVIRVDHDGGVTTNSSRVYADYGDSKTITFTERNGYDIRRIDVVVNGKTYSAYRNDSYITINGIRCSLSWTSTRASITLKSIRADMDVFCDTDYDGTNDSFYGEDYVIRVDHDGGATASSTRYYVDHGESQIVTFTERNGYDIRRIDVTVNGKVYSAYRGDAYIMIDGSRCALTWTSTKATITLNYIRADMDVFCDTDYNGTDSSRPVDSDYVVTLVADNGCDFAGSGKIGVNSGNDKTVSFTANNSCKLEQLVITYKGSTYRVARGTSYVYIDGNRCSVTWTGSSKVSIALRNIRGDMTVEAESNYWGAPIAVNTITKRPGSHTTIYTNAKNDAVNRKDSVTITVSADPGYIVDTVEFKYRGVAKSAVVYQDTAEFKLDGTTYRVERGFDGTVVVRFDRLTDDITVTSTARQDAIHGNTYHTAYIYGIGNGEFQPDRAVTRAEALAMLLRAYDNGTNPDMTGVVPAPFLDVQDGSWYAKYVTLAHNRGLLQGLHGVNIVSFRPNEVITRSEFVEMAARIMGVTVNGYANTQFSDVMAGHWASGIINYATNQGWINGYPNGAFGPDDSLTRAQLVTIINKALGRNGSASTVDTTFPSLVTFTDVKPSYWAYYQILEAANEHYCNVINGVEQWVR